MEQKDLALIKAENDRLMTDIEKLKQLLRGEISRTQAGVRLSLNLEKGRMREEASGQELKIKEVDTRIEQEIANLRTNIQSSKATTLQYLVGFGEWGSTFLDINIRVYYSQGSDTDNLPICRLLISDRLFRPTHGVLTVQSMMPSRLPLLLSDFPGSLLVKGIFSLLPITIWTDLHQASRRLFVHWIIEIYLDISAPCPFVLF